MPQRVRLTLPDGVAAGSISLTHTASGGRAERRRAVGGEPAGVGQGAGLGDRQPLTTGAGLLLPLVPHPGRDTTVCPLGAQGVLSSFSGQQDSVAQEGEVSTALVGAREQPAVARWRRPLPLLGQRLLWERGG